MRTGGFEASGEFSSPNLGLVSLKRDRMVDWLRTVCGSVAGPDLALTFLSQQVPDDGRQKLIGVLF